MGGYGSGRRWRSKKDTVEDCWDLDVNWMVREGVFDGGKWCSGAIRWSDPLTGEETSSLGYQVNTPQRWLRLHYRLPEQDESFDYKVQLTTTALPWGGVRWWFICPLITNDYTCGRRVGKLYLGPGGRYYGCRHCNDLTYKSCQESHKRDSMWCELAAQIGMWPGDLDRMMEDATAWESRAERLANRNEQRRRRQKRRSVA